jgi:hypothetical protein
LVLLHGPRNTLYELQPNHSDASKTAYALLF